MSLLLNFTLSVRAAPGVFARRMARFARTGTGFLDFGARFYDFGVWIALSNKVFHKGMSYPLSWSW